MAWLRGDVGAGGKKGEGKGVSHMTQNFDIKCPSRQLRILISSPLGCPPYTRLSVMEFLGEYELDRIGTHPRRVWAPSTG